MLSKHNLRSMTSPSKLIQSLEAFIVGNHVFINLPTGYGKSLIILCLPIVANVPQNKLHGLSIVAVTSPLHHSDFVTINPSNAA